MIRLHGISHSLKAGDNIFDGLTMDIPSDRRVAILGQAWSGKTTLIQLLSGLITPKRGRIERFASLSFPAGYQRGFRVAHSGRQNVMFAAKIYGADPQEVFAFVSAVTGLGEQLEQPLRNLPVQSRIRLSYALTYAIPFDTYLFDNHIGGVDPEFRARCQAMLEGRTRNAGAILATRQPRVAEQLCDCAYVIRNNGLTFFENIGEAIAVFEADTAAMLPPLVAQNAPELAEARG